MNEIVEKPKVSIHFKPEIDDTGQVIIHGKSSGGRTRLWPDHTVLIPHGFNKICKLVYSEGISLYPNWSNGDIKFIMIFEGLPNGCQAFDLIEQIPESGGFKFPNITRNNSDVYKLIF